MTEEISTEREAEIERVNRWNGRLESTWDELMTQNSPLTLRIEYIHKFVTSFNTLSKARRDLKALDMPKRLVLEDANDTPPVSIDKEVQRLTESLSMNDKPTNANTERAKSLSELLTDGD